MAKGNATEGIYSATYSGIPVWEFQFGDDLKEHVMRRRHDDWINATHILKAAGFDKPARTRILEREVQKGVHEKIQGGYGKYQGTWIPLDSGRVLADHNHVLERLRLIFDFQPGLESPPPAPRHVSKPKAPRTRPAVPKWNTKLKNASRARSSSHGPPGAPLQTNFDHGEAQTNGDDTPDNITVASASYMAEEDGYDASQYTAGHGKRKREELLLYDMAEQQHSVYGDALLDYFMLSRNERPAIRPEPPQNFQPDWRIDTEKHTALHWASSMGDVEVVRQVKRFGAHLAAHNMRGETPLMRCVTFTNSFEKETFPQILKELIGTVDARDHSGCTVIHHAAVMKSGRVIKHSCSRYYLDNILNRLQETHHPDFVQNLMDAQDNDGNTAVHLAAQRGARKCVRALLGRGASVNIPNNLGVLAEDLIKELNATKSKISHGPSRAGPQRSSSPFGPESQRHVPFRDALTGPPDLPTSKRGASLPALTASAAPSFTSDAARTVQDRITPLIISKFADLAQSYQDELRAVIEAEKDASRILVNTQAELAAARLVVENLESRLVCRDNNSDGATRDAGEVQRLHSQLVDLVGTQNRIALLEFIETCANGSGSEAEDDAEDTPAERMRLATELQSLAQELHAAEKEYVEARSVVGTGERIDKYRHLLKSCLGPDDQDMLDANLDDMIRMMEEEADPTAGPPGGGDASATVMAGGGSMELVAV